jgi:hypothetical protein
VDFLADCILRSVDDPLPVRIFTVLLKQSYAIITTTANELMAPFHDRMPVILRPRDYDRWMQREPTEQPPVDLLRPFDADEMEMHPANPAVGTCGTMGRRCWPPRNECPNTPIESRLTDLCWVFQLGQSPISLPAPVFWSALGRAVSGELRRSKVLQDR